MNLLLDTHVFIWFDSSTTQLSAKVTNLLLDREHHLYLSLVSIWEIQIKAQLGRLSLQKSLSQIIFDHQTQNRLQLLPIYTEHILGLSDLPHHHHDPFDRLIISQAKIENLSLVTHDRQISQYAIHCIW